MNPTQTSAPTLTIARTFNAPRARVFRALCEADLVSKWFAPDGTPAQTQWDAREGGRYRVAMSMPDGDEYIVTGIFSAVRAPEHLAFSFRWLEDDPAQEHDTYVTIDLADRGATTDLVMTQTNFRSEESRDNHNGGWSASLGNLAKIVETA